MLEKHKAENLVNHLDLLSVKALEMKATLCYLNKNIPDSEQVILRSTLKDLEQAIRALEYAISTVEETAKDIPSSELVHRAN